MHEATYKELKKWAVNSALFLWVIYIVMLAARLNWLFDLFSHFRLQLAIGALLLIIAGILLKVRKVSCAAALLLTLCLFDIFRYVDLPDNKNAVPAFTLLHFNSLFVNKHLFDTVEPWIIEHKEEFDVIVLQEATSQTALVADHIKNLYPHQIRRTREDGFGMILASKYPIEKQKVIPIPGPLFENMMFRAEIALPQGAVTFFALHALPPMGGIAQNQRNLELRYASEIISKDKSERKIFSGDWNITPYSPYFRDVLETTGLRHQLTGFKPNGSWPYIFNLPFMTIPIDQVIFSKNMTLLKRETDDFMGSDHRPIIATFSYLP